MDYDRLRELQEKFEENPRRYFAPLANEYRKGGQPKRAIEICRAQLAQMPGHMSGLIVFGQALYEASEFEEARQVFERALTLDPENLIALRSLGDMSLQSGNTPEARRWYMRLLDADPKDTAVIALVSEIEESAEAAPLAAPDEFPVDTDGGDQAIPFIADATGKPIEPELQSSAAPEPGEPQPTAPAPTPESATPPLGLERHYPVEPEAREAPAAQPATTPELVAQQSTERTPAEREPVEQARAAESPAEQPQAAQAPVEPPPPPFTPLPFEDEIPLGAEGLHSAISSEPRGAESLRSLLKPEEPAGAEGLRGNARSGGPVGTEGLKGKPVPSPLEGAAPSHSDNEAAEALDSWTPPPGANVHERAASPKDERMFSGPSPEPFVNETMAQLYLQQGYRQLALKVYYQLAEARPNDQGLKDRIAEIEAADRAAHPEAAAQPRPEAPPVARPTTPPVEVRPPTMPAPRVEAPPPTTPAPRVEAPPPAPPAPRVEAPPPARPVARPVEARREPPPVERPSPPPAAPRSPSIESPTPGGAPESEESPSFDRTPIDSPPSRPSPGRESIESPSREEPRAEPEGIAARQPSIKEFFATLGRKRPPRAAASGGGPQMRAAQVAPPEPAPAPLPPSGPAPSLDAVFAGASVDPADSRAASRLAGAFSGATGATTRTPPTPPTPTPRVNPRLPQAQESEEDVAKFRAWLDGLTGE